MKQFKGFIIGIMVATFVFTSAAFGAGIKQTIEVVFNSVNVSVEGISKGQIGENYMLANGDQVPFSISYKGTTYLPIRKVSELVNKDILWDGNTSTINLKTPTTTGSSGGTTAITNSRSNPAKIGVPIVVSQESFLSGKSKLEISVIDSVRGQEAADMVKSANMFNEAANPGFEYLLVKFNVKVLESENDNPVSVSPYMFDAVRKDGTVYSDFFSVVINDELSTELYQGSNKQGFVAFLIEQGDVPLVRVSETYNTYKWFSVIE